MATSTSVRTTISLWMPKPNPNSSSTQKRKTNAHTQCRQSASKPPVRSIAQIRQLSPSLSNTSAILCSTSWREIIISVKSKFSGSSIMFYRLFSTQMRMKAIMGISVRSSSMLTIGAISEFVFKIFDSAYFQPFLNGYYRAQKHKTYCAPQVLANLVQKRIYPTYNHNIADTFSIGLVVLYCMSSVNPLGAYTNKNEIDFYYIQSMFRLAERKGYSLGLIGLVRECLQQKNRPNVTEILLKFQQLKFKSFMESATNKFSLKKSRTGQNHSSSQSK